jgi:hypothetical protein
MDSQFQTQTHTQSQSLKTPTGHAHTSLTHAHAYLISFAFAPVASDYSPSCEQYLYRRDASTDLQKRLYVGAAAVQAARLTLTSQR